MPCALARATYLGNALACGYPTYILTWSSFAYQPLSHRLPACIPPTAVDALYKKSVGDAKPLSAEALRAEALRQASCCCEGCQLRTGSLFPPKGNIACDRAAKAPRLRPDAPDSSSPKGIMELSIRLPTRDLRRWLTIAVACAPLAGSFYSVPGLTARNSHGLSSNRVMGGARATTPTSCAATLFSLEEEAALEEKGVGNLPSWDMMPFSEKFDQLQGELTRYVRSTQHI